MVPDPTTPVAEKEKRGRKRKNETTPPPPKRPKASKKKEDEKENTIKTPTATPASSVASSSRVSPSASNTSSRRKAPPESLKNIKQPLKTCRDAHVLFNKYRTQNQSECKLFLLRNVIETKKFIRTKAKSKPRKKGGLVSKLETLLERALARNHHHNLGSVEFNQLKCWLTPKDIENVATDAACVWTFTLIVDASDSVRIIRNGLTTISGKEPKINEFTKEVLSQLKNITVTREEIENVKHIYYAAILKRMTQVDQKRGVSRKSLPAPSQPPLTNVMGSPMFLNHEVLKESVRVGCIRVYEKDKKYRRTVIEDRMIVVEPQDLDPVIFHDMNGFEPMEWMRCARNLEFLNKFNKTNQDSYLPRLMFHTDEMDLDFEPSSSPSPRKSPRKVSVRTPEKDSILNPVTSPDQPGTSSSYRRDAIGNFSSIVKTTKSYRTPQSFNARFPCFTLEKGRIISVPEYFKDDYVKLWELALGRRPYFFVTGQPASAASPSTPHRSLTVSPKTPSTSDSSLSARNIHVDNTPTYGLDFVQSDGHNSFIRCKYQTRKSVLAPAPNPIDPIPERKECFPVNNAPMFAEFEMLHMEKEIIPPEYKLPGSEMSLVRVPLSKAQTDAFNQRLANVVIKKKMEVPRKRNPDHVVGAPGADLDGRPIPTFSELYFPPGKSEIYDNLLRYYLAEVGHRPGSFSAQWKSEVLTGFVNKYHDHIFKYNLGNIFEKHIQLVALNSPGWTSVHYNLPRDKYFELKKEWNRKQQSSQQ